jgi:hypothetical protein
MEHVGHSRGCTDFNDKIILLLDEVVLVSSLRTTRKELLPELSVEIIFRGM